MLDPKFIRENPQVVRKSVSAKQMDPKLVDEFLKLDERWRQYLGEVEELQRQRNLAAKERNIEKGKKIKKQLADKEPELAKIESSWRQTLYQIPNILAADVPIGKGASENVVVRKWGKPQKFSFKPKDHMHLGTALDIIDVETAARVSGPRFGYLKGDAALLEYALVQYAFHVLADEKLLSKIAAKVKKSYSANPFVPVVPPVMIKPDVFEKMARRYPEEERYYIPSDDLFLIGSAEHTLGPLHMNETLKEGELPKRYVGFSTAFRREAGSYGKDTKGILRVHQFDKVEMESFTLPETSRTEQDFIVGIQEYLMQSLDIPYQIVMICSGDMGGPDDRQIDLESWLPSENNYRETHTSDSMTDYQSRRLNTKVARKDKTDFVHMNDATVFAIGRTLIAILENYQKEDGTVDVPEVLVPYLGKKVIGKK